MKKATSSRETLVALQRKRQMSGNDKAGSKHTNSAGHVE